MTPGDGAQPPASPEPAPASAESASARSTFGEVFRIAEFRALWSAQVLSVIGDQLARVALTLLVFDQTRSAVLAAVTFAASVVPTFVGGVALSGLADLLPRRQVMIICDLSRAVLVAVMALPQLPLGARVALLFVVTMISAPYSSARAALYPDILGGDLYVIGTAVTITTLQLAQVAGFAVGGAVVGFFGVRTSLLADAATFIFSAVILRFLVLARPRAAAGRSLDSISWSGIVAGLRLVFAEPGLRTPMLLGWLAAFVDVQEGIAPPLASDLGAGAVAVGLILASSALGSAAGAIAFGRLASPAQRLRWMTPLATASCAILILFVFRPGLLLALVVLTVSGILSCYQLPASAAFVTAAPPSQRSQAFGVAQGGMALGQGAMMILAGAAVSVATPSVVIAASGAIGAGLAVLLSFGRAPSP